MTQKKNKRHASLRASTNIALKVSAQPQSETHAPIACDVSVREDGRQMGAQDQGLTTDQKAI